MAVVSKSAAAVRTPTPVAAPKAPAANPFAAAVVQPRPGVPAQPVAPQLNQNVSQLLAQQQAARDAVARQQAQQAQAAAQAQQAQMVARQQAAQQQAAQAQRAQQNALQAHLDQVARDTAARQAAAQAMAQQQAAQQAAARAAAQQTAQAQQAEQIRAANAAYAAQQAAKTAPATAPQPGPQPVPQPVQQAPVQLPGQIYGRDAMGEPLLGPPLKIGPGPDGNMQILLNSAQQAPTSIAQVTSGAHLRGDVTPEQQAAQDQYNIQQQLNNTGSNLDQYNQFINSKAGSVMDYGKWLITNYPNQFGTLENPNWGIPTVSTQPVPTYTGINQPAQTNTGIMALAPTMPGAQVSALRQAGILPGPMTTTVGV